MWTLKSAPKSGDTITVLIESDEKAEDGSAPTQSFTYGKAPEMNDADFVAMVKREANLLISEMNATPGAAPIDQDLTALFLQ